MRKMKWLLSYEAHTMRLHMYILTYCVCVCVALFVLYRRLGYRYRV